MRTALVGVLIVVAVLVYIGFRSTVVPRFIDKQVVIKHCINDPATLPDLAAEKLGKMMAERLASMTEPQRDSLMEALFPDLHL
ncbi:MAG: hypothetical protein PHY34_03900 [Patescibacteria group bacterium]|nr:hypothetical protein [Patescibacteria group bacterium]